MQNRWRDPRAIRHRVFNRNHRPVAARHKAIFRLRAVSRRNHQRKPRRPHAIVQPRLVLVLDLDRHRLARPDIGQRRREQVRPLFFHKARALPVGGRLLIDDARFLPLLDIALDEAITDHDAQRVHRRVLGKRKRVNALNPLVGRVGEALGQRRSNDRPRNLHLHIGRHQRRLDIAARRRRLQQQRSSANVTLGNRSVLRVSGRHKARCSHQRSCKSRARARGSHCQGAHLFHRGVPAPSNEHTPQCERVRCLLER